MAKLIYQPNRFIAKLLMALQEASFDTLTEDAQLISAIMGQAEVLLEFD